jgi:hypothetical protein
VSEAPPPLENRSAFLSGDLAAGVVQEIREACSPRRSGTCDGISPEERVMHSRALLVEMREPAQTGDSPKLPEHLGMERIIREHPVLVVVGSINGRPEGVGDPSGARIIGEDVTVVGRSPSLVPALATIPSSASGVR